MCVFPFFRIRISSRHLPMKAVEFARGWKDQDFVYGQALLTFQLMNNKKNKENNDVKVLFYRLSVVLFFFCYLYFSRMSDISPHGQIAPDK